MSYRDCPTSGGSSLSRVDNSPIQRQQVTPEVGVWFTFGPRRHRFID